MDVGLGAIAIMEIKSLELHTGKVSGRVYVRRFRIAQFRTIFWALQGRPQAGGLPFMEERSY